MTRNGPFALDPIDLWQRGYLILPRLLFEPTFALHPATSGDLEQWACFIDLIGLPHFSEHEGVARASCEASFSFLHRRWGVPRSRIHAWLRDWESRKPALIRRVVVNDRKTAQVISFPLYETWTGTPKTAEPLCDADDPRTRSAFDARTPGEPEATGQRPGAGTADPPSQKQRNRGAVTSPNSGERHGSPRVAGATRIAEIGGPNTLRHATANEEKIPAIRGDGGDERWGSVIPDPDEDPERYERWAIQAVEHQEEEAMRAKGSN